MSNIILRISSIALFFVFLGTIAAAIYAEDDLEGNNKIARGVAVNILDWAQFGELWEQFDTLESLFMLDFKAPHKGFYRYEDFRGDGAGSWGEVEAQEMYFGNYNGSKIAEINGCPAVFFLGRYVAGEECDMDNVCYESEGYYKTGIVVDGELAGANDYGISFNPIPPEGYPWLSEAGLGDNGEEQARSILDYLLSGQDWFCYYFEMVAGDISIE